MCCKAKESNKNRTGKGAREVQGLITLAYSFLQNLTLRIDTFDINNVYK